MPVLGYPFRRSSTTWRPGSPLTNFSLASLPSVESRSSSFSSKRRTVWSPLLRVGTRRRVCRLATLARHRRPRGQDGSPDGLVNHTERGAPWVGGERIRSVRYCRSQSVLSTESSCLHHRSYRPACAHEPPFRSTAARAQPACVRPVTAGFARLHGPLN